MPTKDILLATDALEWLYAPDTQVHPFARYSFTDDEQLLTPWPTGANRETAERWADHRVASFDSVSVLLKQLFTDTIRERADTVWDIHFDYSNHFKARLRGLQPVEGEPHCGVSWSASYPGTGGWPAPR